MKKGILFVMLFFGLIALISFGTYLIEKKQNQEKPITISDYSKSSFVMNLWDVKEGINQLNKNIGDFRIFMNTGSTLEDINGLFVKKGIYDSKIDWSLLKDYNLEKVEKNCFVYAFNIDEVLKNESQTTIDYYKKINGRESYDKPGCSKTSKCYIIFTEKSYLSSGESYDCK